MTTPKLTFEMIDQWEKTTEIVSRDAAMEISRATPTSGNFIEIMEKSEQLKNMKALYHYARLGLEAEKESVKPGHWVCIACGESKRLQLSKDCPKCGGELRHVA